MKMVKEASVGITVKFVKPSYVKPSNESRDRMDEEFRPLSKSAASSECGNPAHAFVLQFKRLQSCHQ